MILVCFLDGYSTIKVGRRKYTTSKFTIANNNVIPHFLTLSNNSKVLSKVKKKKKKIK